MKQLLVIVRHRAGAAVRERAMMRHRLATLALVVSAAMGAGCGRADVPASPSPLAPSPPRADGPPLTVTAISPNVGSTIGGTPMQITGTGFTNGATVTFGGATVAARFDSRDTAFRTLLVNSPAHAAGAVDVIVTLPSGQSGSLNGGYTYAVPQSFDFNGTWLGFGNAGQDVLLGFTVRDNVLVSVTCDAVVTTLSQLPQVTEGQFTVFDDHGVTVSGRIVSALTAIGTMNIAPCVNTDWNATRQ